MARHPQLQPILDAAEVWKHRCVIGETSVFTDLRLWTHENFKALNTHYVQAPDPSGSSSFIQKIRVQLEPVSENAQCLWSEMTWVYLLIQNDAMKADTKRDRIREYWGWSKRRFPHNHELLSSGILDSGVGTGPAFTIHAWREYSFFVVAMLDWFSHDLEWWTRHVSKPWEFAAWLDPIEQAHGPAEAKRGLRDVLLYLLFPDEFEPIVSPSSKKKIIECLGDGTAIEERASVDRELLALRERLVRESGQHEMHFWMRPFVEFWDDAKAQSWLRDKFGDVRTWHMNMNVLGEDMWPRLPRTAWPRSDGTGSAIFVGPGN